MPERMPFAVEGRFRIRPVPFRESATSATRALGAVVYAATSKDGLIKIGFTTNLPQRIKLYGGSGSLLAVLPGTEVDEQQLHQSLTAHVARGREYYHRHPDVLAVVNAMRAQMGADALAS